MNAAQTLKASGLEVPVIDFGPFLRGEPGVPPTQSKHYNLRIVEPILDAMQVEHHLVEADGEAGKVTGLIEAAYEKSAPVAILIGGEPRP